MKVLNEDILVWVDLETTGLSPTQDSILEIGIVLSDRHTHEVKDATNWVVVPMKRSSYDYARFEAQKIDELKASVPEVVLEMHTQNGLWDELEKSTLTLFDAGKQIPEWLTMNGLDLKNQIFTMAGRGVDRFDRPYLRHNSVPLNNIDSLFHYRSLDVSNIYQAFRFIGRPLDEGLYNDRKEAANFTMHRAVDDCLEALLDWRHFVETFQ